MTTWVLLRGLAREARHWGDFATTLGAALPGARVVAIDLPGNGRLNTQPSPLTVAAMVDAARRQLAARGITPTPPCYLLALSLGAMVALAWAAQHPDEVAGAVLINTSLRGVSPLHHRLRPANLARLLGVLGAGSDLERERAILALTSARVRGADDEAALLARWCAIRRTAPVSAANVLRQLIAAARYRLPRLPPPVPLLVVSSLGDRLVDARCSQRLAERWRLPHAIHPSAGHDLPLDDARWLAKTISGWAAASGDALVRCEK